MASRINLRVPFLSGAAILFCFVTAGSLCLYLFCLAPTITTAGDSGELISASFRLGIAHPSGYALYCLLGKAFATLLPWGEIAWRYNFFSAICGAVTTGLVAVLVERHLIPLGVPKLQRLWSTLGAGWLLAGFIFFGAQALIAEVYAPAGLAVATLIFCATAWHQTRSRFWLFGLFLALGLALSLHLSTVFLWPGLLILAIWQLRTAKSPLSWRRLASTGALATLAFIVGLSVTLYLPWRASTFPEPPREIIAGQEYTWWQPLDWGHPADFERWKAHVSVQQYKSLLWKPVTLQLGGHEFQLRTFAQSPAAALQRLKELCGFVALQWLWCTPLVLLGAWASWRPQKQRGLAALLTTTFAINVFIAIHYKVDNVFDIANFLFPSYVIMAIWLGIGIAALLTWAAKQGSWSWRLSTLTKLAIIGAIVTQWCLFVSSASWRGNTRVYDETLLRADAIEKLQAETNRPPTLLTFTDDTLFPFWYLQHIEGRAPQTQTPYGPALVATQAAGQLNQYANRLLNAGPVAITQWEEELDAKFPYAPLTPNGNLWELTPHALPPAAKPINKTLSQQLDARFLQKEIRRAEVIGFQIDFAYSPFPGRADEKSDPIQKARQTGWVEVLIAPVSLTLTPRPEQTTTKEDSASPPIFKQTRRLIVLQNAHRGQILRTIVPLQVPIGMPPQEYDVWARIVPEPNDHDTPWTASGRIKLIVR